MATMLTRRNIHCIEVSGYQSIHNSPWRNDSKYFLSTDMVHGSIKQFRSVRTRDVCVSKGTLCLALIVVEVVLKLGDLNPLAMGPTPRA